MRAICLLMVVAACGGGDGGGQTPPVDSTPTPVDARPPSGAHMLFLAFDSIAVTVGPTDDATTNTSSISPSSGMSSALYADDPQRTARIAAIVDEITSVLAPYDIGVVTSRPSSGPYDMVHFGGSAQELGFEPSFALIAFGPTDCGDVVSSNLGFVFEPSAPEPAATHTAAQLAVSLLGKAHGIGLARAATDCLCWDVDLTIPCDTMHTCTFHGTSTPVYDTCGDATTFDPNQAMLDAFGPHP